MVDVIPLDAGSCSMTFRSLRKHACTHARARKAQIPTNAILDEKAISLFIHFVGVIDVISGGVISGVSGGIIGDVSDSSSGLA